MAPDAIPREAWKALDEEGIDILRLLMKKIKDSETIPEKWRESLLIPIFRERGHSVLFGIWNLEYKILAEAQHGDTFRVVKITEESSLCHIH